MSYTVKIQNNVSKKRGVYHAHIVKAIDWCQDKHNRHIEEQMLWVPDQVKSGNFEAIITLYFDIERDIHKKTYFISKNRMFVLENLFRHSGALDAAPFNKDGTKDVELSALLGKHVKVFCFGNINPSNGNEFTDIYDTICTIDKPDSFLENIFKSDAYIQNKLMQAKSSAQMMPSNAQQFQQPAQFNQPYAQAAPPQEFAPLQPAGNDDLPF